MHLSLSQVSAAHPAARRGAAPALRGITLSLRPGEQAALIGPSGAGKTTLLQVAAAALRPASGRVDLDGIDPWTLPVRALQRLRGRLLLAPQVPPLPPRQRVITSVLAARLPAMGFWTSLRSLFYPVDIPGAHAALERFDLAEKLFERVDRLSGGERQRVGLARALLAPANLWLVDEPLSALDPRRAEQAIDALVDEARARGATLLASLHQVDVALARFTRVIGLRDGALFFDLPAAEVTAERLRQLYAQHEDELRAPAAQDTSAPGPKPVVMHCR
ncbi:phosphonate ABC transporter ATP-binding protein [Azohydromonas caseinilytica]|uniref:ATP-binding cassette domain-containing protein n=1 Tax=Azohydromonas caseinilytica TaxID=2728836 RepID=A0A848F8H7_9BURK|nr:ATP-binding cassette domain-containing protein [Azohydromonas caseinilytica]NML15518.1 ATP-binding cassette domain-containing protein [Azohydromonas caseinilytica]